MVGDSGERGVCVPEGGTASEKLAREPWGVPDIAGCERKKLLADEVVVVVVVVEYDEWVVVVWDANWVGRDIFLDAPPPRPYGD